MQKERERKNKVLGAGFESGIGRAAGEEERDIKGGGRTIGVKGRGRSSLSVATLA